MAAGIFANYGEHEKRQIKRIPLECETRVQVTFPDGSCLEALDFSSFGFSVQAPVQLIDAVEAMDLVELTVQVPGLDRHRVAVATCWRSETDEHRCLAGFRIVHPDEAGQGQKLEAGLTPIDEQGQVSAFLIKDLFYSEVTTVKLIGLAHRKMVFLVRDVEIILVPNMILNLHFFGSHLDKHPLRVRVESIEESHGSIRMTTVVETLPASVETYLVNYLMQFTDLSVQKLRAFGLRARAVASNLRFRVVRSHEDYMKVLRLRLDAYARAGKTNAEDPMAMQSDYDHKSRIIVAYHGRKVVGSVAMYFPEDESVTLETERSAPNGYPAGFPKKTEVIEIARLCTSDDYSSSDLLKYLMNHVYKNFQLSDRRYFVTSCDDNLWNLYKRVGFRKLGITYDHQTFTGVKHHIIIFDLQAPLWTRLRVLLSWAYVFGDADVFLERTQVSRTRQSLSWLQRVGRALLRAFRRFVRLRRG